MTTRYHQRCLVFQMALGDDDRLNKKMTLEMLNYHAVVSLCSLAIFTQILEPATQSHLVTVLLPTSYEKSVAKDKAQPRNRSNNNK